MPDGDYAILMQSDFIPRRTEVIPGQMLSTARAADMQSISNTANAWPVRADCTWSYTATLWPYGTNRVKFRKTARYEQRDRLPQIA